MHRRALAASSLLVFLATTTGCASSASFWDHRRECLKDPSAYAALAPYEASVQSGSIREEAAGGTAADKATTTFRIERRDCWFHVRARSPKGTDSFGPYESVSFSSLPGAAPGRYMFIAHPTESTTTIVIDGKESAVHEEIDTPRFSAGAKHIAYLAWDAKRGSLTLDGKQIAPGEARSEPTQLLAVLDDGRAAFTQRSKDGRLQLVVGSYVSAPFDSMSYWSVWRGTRFSASLQHGTEGEVLVGERSEHPEGTPASPVTFTANGAHFYFVTYRGDLPEKRYDLVIDGVAHPLPPSGRDGTPNVNERNNVYFMDVYPPVQTGSSEHGIAVINLPAPAAAPARDEYTAMTAGKVGYYVMIGGSRGPQMESVSLDSLHVDERGHLHYLGTRDHDTYEVVDNVLQALPLATPGAALKVPESSASPQPPR